jgi:hypothetical protein
MKDIEWGEWEELSFVPLMYDSIRTRLSNEPVKAWMWSQGEAMVVSGKIAQYHAFLAGKLAKETFFLVPDTIDTHIGGMALRSDADWEDGVFGFTKLECLRRVRELRVNHLNSLDKTYRAVAKMVDEINEMLALEPVGGDALEGIDVANPDNPV